MNPFWLLSWSMDQPNLFVAPALVALALSYAMMILMPLLMSSVPSAS